MNPLLPLPAMKTHWIYDDPSGVSPAPVRRHLPRRWRHHHRRPLISAAAASPKTSA